MIIEDKIIDGKNLRWILRCPRKEDANELSKLRGQIDGETENLDRESGEAFLTPEDFEEIICEDNTSKINLFLVAEVGGKIVGFSRLEGNKLINDRIHKDGKYYNTVIMGRINSNNY
ncbi:hypothetical protein [Clostridium diolis]|uniref:GNAT family N-acetyltransferase n=1 Tax=Clostridium diolis TaxID=223919 RepID=A0AAV3W4Q9_9CLOT|nr:hypothetical protein [Clostridium diolis]QES74972.1 hypothetical protein F3K33_20125 [Clostridium diolis]GEA33445.1 hypothetical protein CDIOL_43680 [Clostridium diolis]